MCPFCDAYATHRQISARFRAEGLRRDIAVAIVEHIFNQKGRCSGRSLDYIKDGKGALLNYCPTCGRKLEETP